MSKVTVMAGPCKMHTVIMAEKIDRKTVSLDITSECKAFRNLNDELNTVNVNDELFSKTNGKIAATVNKCALHPSCPVGIGILKAVEVAAGMALNVNPEIIIEK